MKCDVHRLVTAFLVLFLDPSFMSTPYGAHLKLIEFLLATWQVPDSGPATRTALASIRRPCSTGGASDLESHHAERRKVNTTQARGKLRNKPEISLGLGIKY